jgi:hypothetical protein
MHQRSNTVVPYKPERSLKLDKPRATQGEFSFAWARNFSWIPFEYPGRFGFYDKSSFAAVADGKITYRVQLNIVGDKYAKLASIIDSSHPLE